MKILKVIHRYPPAMGGSEKVGLALAKEYQKNGHEVTIATTTSFTNSDTRGFSTSRPFTLKQTCKKTYFKNEDGIKVWRFEPTFQFWPFVVNFKMKKWLKKNSKKYDVIHLHGYQTYEALITSKLKVPYILTAHDVIAHYGGVLGKVKKVFDIIVGKSILRKAKYLIALTPENFQQYKAILNKPKKIKVIPNGITEFEVESKNLKDLKKELGNPSKIILFVGRIVKYKGVQHIINAMPEILKNEPKAKAVIVGPSEGFVKELKAQAKKLGIEKSVVFTGPTNDPTPYYKVADCFVLASTGEGFGLVGIEAMNNKTPAVLADMGGLKYILKDVGGYPINMKKSEKDISKQISNHVIDVLSDKKMKSKMNAIYKKTQEYTWDSIGIRTLELLEKTKK